MGKKSRDGIIMMRFFILLLAICNLVACNSGKQIYAPVADVSTIERIPKNGVYHAASKDTVYSVAWRYGLDYRYLAKRNDIHSSDHLAKGQVIHLRGQPQLGSVKPVQRPQPELEKHEFDKTVSVWRWPAHGSIVGTFSSSNKGINIAGKMDNPIYATAAGEVVYSGSGLRGYGNLIIIKHNSQFLSAYAHSNTVLVKQGDWVRSGQKIADMGNTDSRRVMLHFEIRRSGQPVNPLNYLIK